MLLLGGSAVVNALTGVNIYAASFLIPLGVIVYTLAGGLKATFLASYIHSIIGSLFKYLKVSPLMFDCSFVFFFNLSFTLIGVLRFSACCFSHLCVPRLHG